METTRHVDHGAPSKYLKQKAKPGLWIKDTNYELTAFWTTLKFEAIAADSFTKTTALIFLKNQISITK